MTNHSVLDWYEDNAEQYASSNPDLPIRRNWLKGVLKETLLESRVSLEKSCQVTQIMKAGSSEGM